MSPLRSRWDSLSRLSAGRTSSRGLALAALLFAALPAWADGGVIPSTQMPSQIREVGIDQKLDAQIPLDLPFVDENGSEVRLGQYFRGKPVILALNYYRCPTLCSMVLNGLTKGLRVVPSMTVGRDFDVLSVSFDPSDTPELAAAKKKGYVAQYGRPGSADGWHFLVGRKEPIARLLDTVGFRAAFDPSNGQYAHGASIMVLTPEGKLSRYFFGLEYSGRDLRLALTEASSGRIGTVAEQILLYCFQYDAHAGRYNLSIMRTLRSSSLLVLFGIVAYIVRARWRERRRELRWGGGPARA